MTLNSTPIFATASVESSIQFYKEVLGFETSWTWGEPPTFGCASWGGASIMFCLQPDLASKVEGHQHWVKVDEVDELYERHVQNGAMIVSPIEDKPWGVREYVVRDPSGYHLRFAGSPASSAEGSRAFPEGVTVVRRKPTVEEHHRIVSAAFESNQDHSDALERAWNGVVALSPEGEAIGTARIVFDSPGWYSVWDVAVLPEWQGRRIGTALMKEAIAAVHDASPGAFLFLFTFKHEFYERLGFSKETVSMLKV